MEIFNKLNKVKIWWLVAIWFGVYIISTSIFDVDVKSYKMLTNLQDSLVVKNDSLEAAYDSLALEYNKVWGVKVSLEGQLDRNARQQIVIDKRTTNITRNYIINDTIINDNKKR